MQFNLRYRRGLCICVQSLNYLNDLKIQQQVLVKLGGNPFEAIETFRSDGDNMFDKLEPTKSIPASQQKYLEQSPCFLP